MRFVLEILSRVLRAVHVDSLAKAVPLAILESAIIDVTIGPSKLSLAIRNAIDKLTLVFESAVKRNDVCHY